MIRSTRLLDLSGLVLDKRNPSSMAIQLVHHNVAAGQSDKVNVFCQGCHDYVGEQECDVLRAKLTPQALLYSLWLRTRLTPRALHALSRTRQPTPTPAYAPPTAIATPRPPSASRPVFMYPACRPTLPGARVAPAARAASRPHAARRAKRPRARRACDAQAVAAAQLEPGQGAPMPSYTRMTP